MKKMGKERKRGLDESGAEWWFRLVFLGVHVGDEIRSIKTCFALAR